MWGALRRSGTAISTRLGGTIGKRGRRERARRDALDRHDALETRVAEVTSDHSASASLLAAARSEMDKVRSLTREAHERVGAALDVHDEVRVEEHMTAEASFAHRLAALEREVERLDRIVGEAATTRTKAEEAAQVSADLLPSTDLE